MPRTPPEVTPEYRVKSKPWIPTGVQSKKINSVQGKKIKTKTKSLTIFFALFLAGRKLNMKASALAAHSSFKWNYSANSNASQLNMSFLKFWGFPLPFWNEYFSTTDAWTHDTSTLAGPQKLKKKVAEFVIIIYVSLGEWGTKTKKKGSSSRL